ncbi:MAG: flagellar biosynthesis anti-sigma factor FlgM [Thiobacillus sp. 65-1059]|nr:MAG: flagellar biosynthesis anti-sigma factor FlgM [Thiobacillus sp. 65-1059]OZA27475.1 MAG: flagellar biosynthesis anti-sigma factor FlgM [Hydrogenophilales bacterium 17-64-11]
MKIDPGLKQVTLPPSVENRPAQPQANKRTGAEQTDVTLSPRAAQLKQLETQLAAIPAIDRARVDGIKEAIASGQYTIKPENIAAGLIDSVKEMLHVAR